MLKDYFLLFKKSGKDFKKNPVLYAPFVIELFAILLLLLLMMAMEVGALYLLFGSLTKIISEMSANIFINPIALILIILFVFLDIFAFVIISSFFRAMKIGMYKEVITGRKTSVAFMFYYAKKFFKKRFEISLIMLLVFLLPFLLLAILTGLFFLFLKNIGVIVAIILGAIYLLYFIITGIIVYLTLFFIDPIIASQERTSLELVSYAWNFARRNFSKVIISLAVVLVFSLVISAILSILELPFELLRLPQYALLISIFLFIARFIVQTGVNIITDLFVFNVYFKSK